MKVKLKNITCKIKKVVSGLALTVAVMMSKVSVAYAATPTPAPTGNATGGNTQTGVQSIDFGIGQLIGLVLGVVSAYGIINLIKAGVDFFSALGDRDVGSMKQSGLNMLSGLGIASIAGVLAFLGFTW